jgi:hypothetical protein
MDNRDRHEIETTIHFEENLKAQLDLISKYGNILKTIIVLSFGAGIWITTLQLKVNELSVRLDGLVLNSVADEKDARLWRASVSTYIETSSLKIGYIEESITEIKNTLEKDRNR